MNNRRYTYEQMFVVNGTTARHAIKRRLIEDKLISYECSSCKNNGEWCGQRLSLHLDHKNGVLTID